MTNTIVVTRYFDHLNPDFQGNPLIEVIPDLSRIQIQTAMSLRISCDKDERSHSAELRMQYLYRLARYFAPLRHQVDMGFDAWSLLLEGYRSRNPLRRQTTVSFNELCDLISTGKSLFNDDDSFSSSPLAAAIIGTPGCGKSKSLQMLLRTFPHHLLHHADHDQLYQLLYLWVEAPDTDGYMSLLNQIYGRLAEIAEDAGLITPSLGKRTRGDLERAIAILVRKLNLGILVVDEIQHIVAGSKGIDAATMKFLTGFINRLGIPVIVIGTWPSVAVLGKEFRLSRRFSGRGSYWVRRMKNEAIWRTFVKGLFQYQWTKENVEYEPAYGNLFYHHCQGVQDLAVKLMMLAQLDAIRSNQEKLSVALFEETVAKHWDLVAPAVRQLRQGRDERNPVLWDLDPPDFEKYFQALVTSNNLSAAFGKSLKPAGIAVEAKVAAVGGGLEALGGLAPGEARPLAEKLVSENPHKSAAKLVESQTKKIPRTRIRTPKNDAERKRIETIITGLRSEDFRRICFEGVQEKRSSIESLFLLNRIETFDNLMSIFQEPGTSSASTTHS
jgi:hypothetical protein